MGQVIVGNALRVNYRLRIGAQYFGGDRNVPA